MINRQVEINAGLRKPPSEMEKLAEEQTMLSNGIKFMISNRQPPNDPNFVMHTNELERVERRMAELRGTGESTALSDAIRAAEQKQRSRDTEMAAMTEAWAKKNPGKDVFEFGGAETQEIYDQVASKPPSAAIDRTDKLVCGYCGKSSAEKLRLCSQCKSVAYCGTECQKSAWKGHKAFCKAKGDDRNSTTGPEKKQPKLPLTWEQVEAFGGLPAEGKVLEVRVMSIIAFGRQVMECKDRVGAVRRVAAYTDSRSLRGAAAGRVLRWKNPRYHYFMDGSSGARIEEEDVGDVSITDS
eukprot:gene24903-33394_t